MGVSRKPKVDAGLESQGQNGVLAMISIRAPLKPTATTEPPSNKDKEGSSDDDEESSCSTTPTAEEARIPTLFTCPPPAPRKPKPSFNFNNYGRTGVRDFFTPPDLESVFYKGKG